jgi:hypothetical protein
MRLSDLFDVEPEIDLSSSQYVGEVGCRQEFILKFERSVKLEMGYAVMLYGFIDLQDNEFVWFASKESSEFELGCTYRVKATVKRHQKYRGTKQTAINRLKVIGPYIRPIEKADIEVAEGASVGELWNAL